MLLGPAVELLEHGLEAVGHGGELILHAGRHLGVDGPRDQAMAEKVVEAAHAICPYSNATRGNIGVATTVRTL
jgi:organic hydroperoxide reductase OsmC/OhrA